MKRSFRAACLATGLLMAAAATPARAATVPGWYSSTDVSFVMSRGNSDTVNVGINTNLTRQWLRTAWRNQGSFVRNDVNEPGVFAVGTPSNFTIDSGPRITKSEKLFFNSDLERRITERFFWNVAGSIERDIFAGLRHRETGAIGIGYLWQKPDNSSLFRMGVAGTYTNQEEVQPDPADPDKPNPFAGVRVTMDGEKRFGDRKQNQFTSNLIVDENVQDTDDLRVNWQNAIAVQMNQRLALKLGAQVAYDHQPQFIDIPLFAPNGADLGQIVGQADELDVSVTMSIVINFSPGQGR